MTLQLGGGGAITGCTSLADPVLTLDGLVVGGTGRFEDTVTIGGTVLAPNITLNATGEAVFLGNVGIGATSVGANLEIKENATTGTNHPMQIWRTASGGFMQLRVENLGLSQPYHEFTTGSTEDIVFSPGGNVGIGTTAPGTVLHCSATDAVLTLQGTRGTGASATIGTGGANSQNLLITAGTDLYYRGASQLFQNVAGTTEYGRWDDAGRLLIGTTSAIGSYNVQISANGATDPYEGSILLRRDLTTSEMTGAAFFLGSIAAGNNSAVGGRIRFVADGAWGTNDYPTRMEFMTTADGASTPTVRMSISSAGVTNVQSPDLSNYAFIAQSTGSSGVQRSALFQFPNNSPNDFSSVFWVGVDSTTTRGAFYSNGGLANYQSNDSNLCDEREKKNIETLDSTWGCLKRWELQKFHYNEDADTDNKRYGVIAQQIAEHCPEVIADWLKQEAKDAVLDDDGNVVTPAQKEIIRMGVKEQQMYWMAIKALQEAMARIEALEVEVASLRSN
jgi:hypothetical protein